MPPNFTTIGESLVVGAPNTHPFLHPGESKPDLIDCPCIIIDNYQGHTSNGFTTITVPIGAKGIVKGLNKNSTYVDVVLLQDQPGVTTYRGWVAARVVKVGLERKYGSENTIRRGLNLVTLGGLTAGNVNVIFNNSPTCQVLFRFWSKVWKVRRTLTCIKQDHLDAIQKYGGPEGVTRKIFSAISKDSPSVAQQLDSNKPYTAATINAGSKGVLKKGLQSVYDKLYDGFAVDSKTGKIKIPGFYAGVTGDPQRDWYHENEFKDPNASAYHYRYAKGATDRKFRTIATFEERDFRPLFEQSIICMFETQAYYIKQAATSISFELISQDDRGDLVNAELGDIADRKIQGKIFYEIFKHAKAAVPQFRGGCDDPTFKAVGLNDDTPLTSWGISEGKFWTKVVVPGKYTEYRRTIERHAAKEGKVKSKAKEDTYEVQVARGSSQFFLTLNGRIHGTEIIPPPGTNYDIVVQVPTHEQQHPNAYARLPKVGPSKDWKKVTGTAIGIQRVNEKGEHVGVWLQASEPAKSIQNKDLSQPVGAWVGYARVEALIRSLELREIIQAPSWFHHYKPPRMLEITYDYLAQTWFETELFPSGVPSVYVESNWRRDAASINAELVAMFGSDAVNKAPVKAFRKHAAYCLRCYLARGGTETGRPHTALEKCDSTVKPDGTCTCTLCRAFGTPCVHLDVDIVLANVAMQDALAPPESKPMVLHKIQNARLLSSNK